MPSTITLTRFNVATVGPRGSGRRVTTVVAADKSAAAAAAIQAHRVGAGLPAGASVLTSGITEVTDNPVAPAPMSKADQARAVAQRRSLTGGNDAA
jgi:hypothetical protein